MMFVYMEIWQVPRKRRRRDASRISERYDKSELTITMTS